MKTANYFKQFLPAVAALTLVGTVSSCRDNDFDWDDAHANSQQKKFEKVFIDRYGKPDPEHQWGFDLAKEAMTSNYASSTRAVYKQDMGTPRVTVAYGKPKDISDREHKEVYAWFSNHKVWWQNNPSKLGTSLYGAGNGETQRAQRSSYVHAINTPAAGVDSKTFYKETMKYGSIVDYPVNSNKLGHWRYETYNFGAAWIQHVAYNKYPWTETDCSDHQHPNNAQVDSCVCLDGGGYIYEIVGDAFFCKHGDTFYCMDKGTGKHQKNSDGTPRTIKDYITQQGNNWRDVQQKYLNNQISPLTKSNEGHASHMDKLTAWIEDGYNGSQSEGYAELNDFNSGNGYGYGLKQGDGYLTQNAILVKDFNPNEWAYWESVSSAFNCKYILVYLKGDGYEGYYLGFDWESKGNEPNKMIQADGICNDWIIKLTSVTNVYENARVMCEDLGGTASLNASDIDYNDIVFDIKPSNSTYTVGLGEVELEVQAAGGTLPLAVSIETEVINQTTQKPIEIPLFEVHQLFGKSVSTMINTGWQGASNIGSKKFKITYVEEGQNSVDASQNKATIVGHFDPDKIYVKVYRHGPEEDIDIKTTWTEADWINLATQQGGTPVKLCVPVSVGWLKERVAIDNGYPDFQDWVANQNDPFWGTGKTINTNNILY